MHSAPIIPEIKDSKDLLKKLEYDLGRYAQSNHPYQLVDCLLTLNALPEWLSKDSTISLELRELAKNKIRVMKGLDGFSFDEAKLAKEIDHQLRFIRLFCNHSKHKTESGHIPEIVAKYSSLPLTLPAKLGFSVVIGNIEFDAEDLIEIVYRYWKGEINKDANRQHR